MVKAAGIFFVTTDGRVLVGHPAGHAKDLYSIPKGKLEFGETTWKAAMRETYEESNIDLRGKELTKIYELPRVKYKHGKKCLYPYVIFESENDIDFKSFDIKCNAQIPLDSKWNPGKFEFDRFLWISFDDCERFLHHTQSECIIKIKGLYESRED